LRFAYPHFNYLHISLLSIIQAEQKKAHGLRNIPQVLDGSDLFAKFKEGLERREFRKHCKPTQISLNHEAILSFNHLSELLALQDTDPKPHIDDKPGCDKSSIFDHAA
jgi:hypothetical protein